MGRGLSSVLYRTDLVDAADVADPSWGLLFNEKYKGKLSMYDTDTTSSRSPPACAAGTRTICI